MYCYDATLNTWTAIAVFPGAARRGAVAFTVNGKGYVGTGQSGAGYTSDFFEYNPGTNSWAPKAALPATPRTSSIGFAIGNYGYVGTGDSNSGSTNDFYRYDPATNTWTVRASVGLVTRQEACGFAVNGKGYIGTGDDYSSGNNYGDFWEYDPLTDQWIQIPDFDGTARRYLCSFVIGNRAYVGTGTNGTNFRDFWLYDKILGLLQEQMLNVDPVVYPNPTTDHVTIDIKNLPEGVSSDQLDVQIIDLTGKLYSNESFVGTKANVDSKELPNGVYMIRLNYSGEPFYTTKIIKE
jgi:hypothetical protein